MSRDLFLLLVCVGLIVYIVIARISGEVRRKIMISMCANVMANRANILGTLYRLRDDYKKGESIDGQLDEIVKLNEEMNLIEYSLSDRGLDLEPGETLFKSLEKVRGDEYTRFRKYLVGEEETGDVSWSLFKNKGKK